jgi:hypothetical protein
MNNNRYLIYAVAALGVGAVALWAGISPLFLIFLLVCPLMMFMMMRGGMHGESGHPDGKKHAAAPTHPDHVDETDPRVDHP